MNAELDYDPQLASTLEQLARKEKEASGQRQAPVVNTQKSKFDYYVDPDSTAFLDGSHFSQR